MTITPTARALNKPLVIAGVERRLIGLCFAATAVIGGLVPDGTKMFKFVPTQLIVGVLVFVVSLKLAKLSTKKDDRFMRIAPSLWRQKAIYDPHKREVFELEIIK